MFDVGRLGSKAFLCGCDPFWIDGRLARRCSKKSHGPLGLHQLEYSMAETWLISLSSLGGFSNMAVGLPYSRKQMPESLTQSPRAYYRGMILLCKYLSA